MTKTAKQIKYGFLIAIALAAALSLAPRPAAAGTCICNGTATETTCNDDSGCGATCKSSPPGVCTGGNSGATSTTPTGTGPSATPLQNPLGVCANAVGQKCVQLVIGNVIKAAMGIVGSIALLMMIWGGFLWLTSMGNSDKVEKGKNTLIWATLGLVIIFAAYAVTNFLITTIAASK